MGASGWSYRMAFHGDIAAALEALQRQAFDDGDYYWPHDGRNPGFPVRPRPSSVEELWQDEVAQETGTHSILDVDRVIASTDTDGVGTVRPLKPEEILSYFGTCTPTPQDFDRVVGQHALPDRMPSWSAWCMPLSVDGLPAHLAIWGFSGD